MVAHYTSAKKLRSDDAYSPGGKAGKRPDRAVIVLSLIHIFSIIEAANGGVNIVNLIAG